MSRRRPETPPERKPLHSYPAPDVPDREPLSLLEQQRRAAPRRPHYLWGNRFDPEPPPKAIPPTQQNKDTTPDTDWSEKQQGFQRCLFAKSCKMPYGSLQAGERLEPLANFGTVALLGATTTTATGDIGLAGAGSATEKLLKLGRLVARRNLALGAAAVGLAATGTAAGAAMLLAFVPRQLQDGTLYQPEDLEALDFAETRVRIGVSESGFIFGVHTGPGSEYSRVKTIPATTQKSEAGHTRLTAELEDGFSLTWYPDGGGELGSSDVYYPEFDGVELDQILVRPIPEPGEELLATSYPGAPETTLKDAIVYFPDRPDLAPLYIVYKTTKELRAESGVATGKGKDVDWEDGYWLGKAANEGQGQYIPTRIAQGLKEHGEFKNFDEFRKVLWTLVSEDEELLKQFALSNHKALRNGQAPISVRSGWYMGPNRDIKCFEIHHVVEIQNGGGVYDIDNLRIVTAKNHKRIHYGE